MLSLLPGFLRVLLLGGTALAFMFLPRVVSGQDLKLTSFFPTGVRVGTSARIPVSGPERWPLRAHVDGPAPGPVALKVEATDKKGKLRVEASPQAAPGVYWIRLTQADRSLTMRGVILR